MSETHKATPRRRGAPPTGQRLSRDAVLARAEQLIDRVGVAGFTLRELAGELDVRPTALYNHVSGRDDLLQAVAERFVGGIVLSPRPEAPWPTWARSMATDLRRQMLAHPHRAELLVSRAPGSPAGHKFLHDFLDELEASGVHRATAHETWHLLLALVIGMVQLERQFGPDPAGTFDAILDVAMSGIVESAARAPSERALVLLRGHPHAATAAHQDTT